MKIFVPSDIKHLILEYLESILKFERRQIINTAVKKAKLVLVLKYLFSAVGPSDHYLNYRLLLDVLKHIGRDIIPF